MEYEHDYHISEVAEILLKRDQKERTLEVLDEYCRHVTTLIETGKLAAKQVPFIMRLNDSPQEIRAGFTPVVYPSLKNIITRAELQRFLENEHISPPAMLKPATTTPPTKPTKKMTKEEFEKFTSDYTAQRRNDGIEDFEIAWELKNKGASFQRIGQIFHPNPPIEPNGYTYRGKQFLGLD